MEQLSKGEEEKLLRELYSFEEIFQDGCLRVWKKKTGLPKHYQVGFEDFQKYIEK